MRRRNNFIIAVKNQAIENQIFVLYFFGANTNPNPILLSIFFAKGKKNCDCPNRYPNTINKNGYKGKTNTIKRI